VTFVAAACAVAVVAGCGSSPPPAPALQIRPVLAEHQAAAGDCATSPAQQPPSASTVQACTADGQFAFRLGPAALSGAEFTDLAVESSSQGSGAVVSASLDPAGAQAFADLTGALAGKPAPENQFAVYVHGQVQSAPFVQAQITGSQLEIAGFGSTADAQRFLDDVRS
jgi:preprotein translocase subunit SecD